MRRQAIWLSLALIAAACSAAPALGQTTVPSGVVIEEYGPRPSARQITAPTLSTGDTAPPPARPGGDRTRQITRLLRQNRSLINHLKRRYDRRPVKGASLAPAWRRDDVSVPVDPATVGYTSPTTDSQGRGAAVRRLSRPRRQPARRVFRLSHRRLTRLIRRRWPLDLLPGNIPVRTRRGKMVVHTTIDPSLQQYLTDLLAKAQVVQAAAVLLDPATGQILALAQFNALKTKRHQCLRPVLAASLFKVITASGALEEGKLKPYTLLQYKGGKYTLRPSQLSRRVTPGTNLTTLENAFAESINPAFGAVALYYLGARKMDRYARRFLFNRRLACEMPVGVSRYRRPYRRFDLAAVASGLNKKTTVTPLHAAMICGAFVNRGRIMAPWIVDQVVDRRGRVVYRGRPRLLAHPVSWRTAKQMQRLMRATVIQGTGRRVFARVDYDSILGRLIIGAKSGTLNSKDQTRKLDWFAGFARERGRYRPGGTLAFAVFMAHSRRWGRGVRAQVIARHAIRHYFRNLFRDRRQRPTIVQRRY